jgi:hypothetical protein
LRWESLCEGRKTGSPLLPEFSYDRHFIGRFFLLIALPLSRSLALYLVSFRCAV